MTNEVMSDVGGICYRPCLWVWAGNGAHLNICMIFTPVGEMYDYGKVSLQKSFFFFHTCPSSFMNRHPIVKCVPTYKTLYYVRYV